MKKICTKCGTEKSLEEFRKIWKNKENRSAKCKVCHAKECAEYYRKNPDRMKQNAYKWNNKNFKRKIINSTRNSARKRGLEFNLTEDDLEIPKKCPILGTPLVQEIQTRGKDADCHIPSIDRIDPNKGYTKDNIAVISLAANRKKQDLTLDEIEKIRKYVKKTAKMLKEKNENE